MNGWVLKWLKRVGCKPAAAVGFASSNLAPSTTLTKKTVRHIKKAIRLYRRDVSVVYYREDECFGCHRKHSSVVEMKMFDGYCMNCAVNIAYRMYGEEGIC